MSVDGHRSRRSWGWHRLHDEWARRVVAQSAVRAGDLVLDLGAGRGALTGPLVEAGATVLAVELNAGRARRLTDRFAAQPVRVVTADLAELRLPGRPFRV
ncbi:MAG TPA: rRNA adenine N-6-methyltransferase family protein, partial [Pseudonocardia sp.]|nr:rRNA adenine N-6-methyltransferase family protein [Pseudonocardia sp.]